VSRLPEPAPHDDGPRYPSGMAEIRTEIRDFRQATTSSFNAMRQDFTDLRQDFTGLRRELVDLRQEMNGKFDQVDRGFMEMRGKLDATAAGQQQIVNMLTTLIDQQDGRPGVGA
jgi:phage-related protein